MSSIQKPRPSSPTLAAGATSTPTSDKRESRLLNLFGAWDNCQRCDLKDCRKNVVFGAGSATAPLVFVGEGPGEQEDTYGEPFVGRAGKLLREIVAEIGVDIGQCFITNCVACRPPQNRVPMPDEWLACKHRLYATLSIIRPKIIVMVGGTAAIALAGIRGGITKNRGRVQAVEFAWKGEDFNIPGMPILHPSGLLRTHSKSDRDRFRLDIAEACRIAGLLEGAQPTTAESQDTNESEDEGTTDGE